MNDSEKSNTVIFGGSFSPPTHAHAYIMRKCLELPDFSSVWVMPSNERQDKNIKANTDDRLNMLGLLNSELFNNDPRLNISDFEINLPPPTCTYNTVGALALTYPENRFWFAFGSDAYTSMESWHQGSFLKRTLNMIIFERDNVLPLSAPNLITIRMNEDESSTKTHVAIAKGEPIDQFVCNSVRNYIKERALFTPYQADLRLV